MIKLGILAGSDPEVELVEEIQQLKIFKVTGVLRPGEDKNEEKCAINDLLDFSDSLYVDELEEPKIESLKSFLRRSNHVFLKKPFFSSLSGIRQLISFQQEAGSVIQLFNPCLFHPEILKLRTKLETPLLIDMEITIADETTLEQELLNMLIFLSGAEKSDFRKLEVFGLQGTKHSLINLHIQFVSGSIGQLKIFTNKDKPGNCKIHIHQKESPPISLEMPAVEEKGKKAEMQALKNFAKGIRQKDCMLVSLNELFQAVSALLEIKEKLKYPNIKL